jgi:hypothetical protein
MIGANPNVAIEALTHFFKEGLGTTRESLHQFGKGQASLR